MWTIEITDQAGTVIGRPVTVEEYDVWTSVRAYQRQLPFGWNAEAYFSLDAPAAASYAVINQGSYYVADKATGHITDGPFDTYREADQWRGYREHEPQPRWS